ncbi:hypothetical protein DYU11_20115 [Fibrisoma montanum]|uniref:Uncharacterized protein n=1 Tax=Fibrisoma montanum TaxID=2305895 RepID=A0A418M3R8_9BACT|nr:hypothetical protein [Fibrisoma montanum]RIV20359.1 hypothetical protein DYU11_20115 [Fibrisoma montanum]
MIHAINDGDTDKALRYADLLANHLRADDRIVDSMRIKAAIDGTLHGNPAVLDAIPEPPAEPQSRVIREGHTPPMPPQHT